MLTICSSILCEFLKQKQRDKPIWWFAASRSSLLQFWPFTSVGEELLLVRTSSHGLHVPDPSLTPNLAHIGRVELRTFLLAYILSLALQIVTTGSVLGQGGTAITVLTAVHAATVASMFWLLFWNGLVATQVCRPITRF